MPTHGVSAKDRPKSIPGTKNAFAYKPGHLAYRRQSSQRMHRAHKPRALWQVESIFESKNEALEKVQNQLPEQPVEGTVCIRSTTPSSPIPPSLNVQKMIELKAMEVETVERATEEMVASLRTHLSDEIPQITSTFPAAPQNNIISNFNINSLNSNKFKEVEHIIHNIEEKVSETSLAPLPFQKYLPPDHVLNVYKGCGDRFWGEHRFHKHPCANMNLGCEFYALVCKSCKKGVSMGEHKFPSKSFVPRALWYGPKPLHRCRVTHYPYMPSLPDMPPTSKCAAKILPNSVVPNTPHLLTTTSCCSQVQQPVMDVGSSGAKSKVKNSFQLTATKHDSKPKLLYKKDAVLINSSSKSSTMQDAITKPKKSKKTTRLDALGIRQCSALDELLPQKMGAPKKLYERVSSCSYKDAVISPRLISDEPKPYQILQPSHVKQLGTPICADGNATQSGDERKSMVKFQQETIIKSAKMMPKNTKLPKTGVSSIQHAGSILANVREQIKEPTEREKNVEHEYEMAYAKDPSLNVQSLEENAPRIAASEFSDQYNTFDGDIAQKNIARCKEHQANVAVLKDVELYVSADAAKRLRLAEALISSEAVLGTFTTLGSLDEKKVSIGFCMEALHADNKQTQERAGNPKDVWFSIQIEDTNGDVQLIRADGNGTPIEKSFCIGVGGGNGHPVNALLVHADPQSVNDLARNRKETISNRVCLAGNKNCEICKKKTSRFDTNFTVLQDVSPYCAVKAAQMLAGEHDGSRFDVNRVGQNLLDVDEKSAPYSIVCGECVRKISHHHFEPTNEFPTRKAMIEAFKDLKGHSRNGTQSSFCLSDTEARLHLFTQICSMLESDDLCQENIELKDVATQHLMWRVADNIIACAEKLGIAYPLETFEKHEGLADLRPVTSAYVLKLWGSSNAADMVKVFEDFAASEILQTSGSGNPDPNLSEPSAPPSMSNESSIEAFATQSQLSTYLAGKEFENSAKTTIVASLTEREPMVDYGVLRQCTNVTYDPYDQVLSGVDPNASEVEKDLNFSADVATGIATVAIREVAEAMAITGGPRLEFLYQMAVRLEQCSCVWAPSYATQYPISSKILEVLSLVLPRRAAMHQQRIIGNTKPSKLVQLDTFMIMLLEGALIHLGVPRPTLLTVAQSSNEKALDAILEATVIAENLPKLAPDRATARSQFDDLLDQVPCPAKFAGADVKLWYFTIFLKCLPSSQMLSLQASERGFADEMYLSDIQDFLNVSAVLNHAERAPQLTPQQYVDVFTCPSEYVMNLTPETRAQTIPSVIAMCAGAAELLQSVDQDDVGNDAAPIEKAVYQTLPENGGFELALQLENMTIIEDFVGKHPLQPPLVGMENRVHQFATLIVSRQLTPELRADLANLQTCEFGWLGLDGEQMSRHQLTVSRYLSFVVAEYEKSININHYHFGKSPPSASDWNAHYLRKGRFAPQFVNDLQHHEDAWLELYGADYQADQEEIVERESLYTNWDTRSLKSFDPDGVAYTPPPTNPASPVLIIESETSQSDSMSLPDSLQAEPILVAAMHTTNYQSNKRPMTTQQLRDYEAHKNTPPPAPCPPTPLSLPDSRVHAYKQSTSQSLLVATNRQDDIESRNEHLRRQKKMRSALIRCNASMGITTPTNGNIPVSRVSTRATSKSQNMAPQGDTARASRNTGVSMRNYNEHQTSQGNGSSHEAQTRRSHENEDSEEAPAPWCGTGPVTVGTEYCEYEGEDDVTDRDARDKVRNARVFARDVHANSEHARYELRGSRAHARNLPDTDAAVPVAMHEKSGMYERDRGKGHAENINVNKQSHGIEMRTCHSHKKHTAVANRGENSCNQASSATDREKKQINSQIKPRSHNSLIDFMTPPSSEHVNLNLQRAPEKLIMPAANRQNTISPVHQHSHDHAHSHTHVHIAWLEPTSEGNREKNPDGEVLPYTTRVNGITGRTNLNCSLQRTFPPKNTSLILEIYEDPVTRGKVIKCLESKATAEKKTERSADQDGETCECEYCKKLYASARVCTLQPRMAVTQVGGNEARQTMVPDLYALYNQTHNYKNREKRTPVKRECKGCNRRISNMPSCMHEPPRCVAKLCSHCDIGEQCACAWAEYMDRNPDYMKRPITFSNPIVTNHQKGVPQKGKNGASRSGRTRNINQHVQLASRSGPIRNSNQRMQLRGGGPTITSDIEKIWPNDCKICTITQLSRMQQPIPADDLDSVPILSLSRQTTPDHSSCDTEISLTMAGQLLEEQIGENSELIRLMASHLVCVITPTLETEGSSLEDEDNNLESLDTPDLLQLLEPPNPVEDAPPHISIDEQGPSKEKERPQRIRKPPNRFNYEDRDQRQTPYPSKMIESEHTDDETELRIEEIEHSTNTVSQNITFSPHEIKPRPETPSPIPSAVEIVQGNTNTSTETQLRDEIRQAKEMASSLLQEKDKVRNEIRQAKEMASSLLQEKYELLSQNENLEQELISERATAALITKQSEQRHKLQGLETQRTIDNLYEALSGVTDDQSKPSLRKIKTEQLPPINVSGVKAPANEPPEKEQDNQSNATCDYAEECGDYSGDNKEDVYRDEENRIHSSKVAFFDPDDEVVYCWYRKDGGIDLPGGKRRCSDQSQSHTLLRECNEEVILPKSMTMRLYNNVNDMSRRFTTECRDPFTNDVHIVSLHLLASTKTELLAIRQTLAGSREGVRPQLRPIKKLRQALYSDAVLYALEYLARNRPYSSSCSRPYDESADEYSDNYSETSENTGSRSVTPKLPHQKKSQSNNEYETTSSAPVEPSSQRSRAYQKIQPPSDSEEAEEEVSIILASFNANPNGEYLALVLDRLNPSILCPAEEMSMSEVRHSGVTPPCRQGFSHSLVPAESNTKIKAMAALSYLKTALGTHLFKILTSTPNNEEINTDTVSKRRWNHPEGGTIPLRMQIKTDENDPQSEFIHYQVWLVDDLAKSWKRMKRIVRSNQESIPRHGNVSIASLENLTYPDDAATKWEQCDRQAFQSLSHEIMKLPKNNTQLPKEIKGNKVRGDESSRKMQETIDAMQAELNSLKSEKQTSKDQSNLRTPSTLDSKKESPDQHKYNTIYSSPMTTISLNPSAADSDLYPEPTNEQMQIYQSSRHWAEIQLILKRKYHPGIVQCGAHRYFLPRVHKELSGFSSEKALSNFANNKTLYPSAKLGVGDIASKVSLEQRALAWNTYLMLLVPVLREAHAHGLPATSWLVRLRSSVLAEMSKKDEEAYAASHNFVAVTSQIENDRILWSSMCQKADGTTIGCSALLLDLWIDLLSQCYVRQTSGFERVAQERYNNFKRASIGDLIECLRVIVDHYMGYKNPPNDPDNISREQLWSSKEHVSQILEKLVETVGEDKHRPWSQSLKNYLRREIDDVHCLMTMGKATLADLAPTPNNLILQRWANMEKYLASEHERMAKPTQKTLVFPKTTNPPAAPNNRQNPGADTVMPHKEYRRTDREENTNGNRVNTRSNRWNSVPEARVASVTSSPMEVDQEDEEWEPRHHDQRVAYVNTAAPNSNPPRHNNGPEKDTRPNKENNAPPSRPQYDQRRPPPPPPAVNPNYNLRSFNSHNAEAPPGHQSNHNTQPRERREQVEVVYGGQRNSLIPNTWSNEQQRAFKSIYINFHAIDDLLGTSSGSEAARIRPLKPYDDRKPPLQATGEQNPPSKMDPESGRRIWPQGACNFCENSPPVPENCRLPPTKQYCYGHWQSNHPSSKCFACKLSILYSKDDKVRRAFAPPELKDVRQPPST